MPLVPALQTKRFSLAPLFRLLSFWVEWNDVCHLVAESCYEPKAHITFAARVLEAWPLVLSYSPAVRTPRDLSVSAALKLHQAQMPGQMLAAQSHIASPRLKHSRFFTLALLIAPDVDRCRKVFRII
jgi:hypothetical protein